MSSLSFTAGGRGGGCTPKLCGLVGTELWATDGAADVAVYRAGGWFRVDSGYNGTRRANCAAPTRYHLSMGTIATARARAGQGGAAV
jgi:hypothetical protein